LFFYPNKDSEQEKSPNLQDAAAPNRCPTHLTRNSQSGERLSQNWLPATPRISTRLVYEWREEIPRFLWSGSAGAVCTKSSDGRHTRSSAGVDHSGSRC
jgi:hypothetical protein